MFLVHRLRLFMGWVSACDFLAEPLFTRFLAAEPEPARSARWLWGGSGEASGRLVIEPIHSVGNAGQARKLLPGQPGGSVW